MQKTKYFIYSGGGVEEVISSNLIHFILFISTKAVIFYNSLISLMSGTYLWLKTFLYNRSLL